MQRIRFIIPYFGKWPFWMPFFLRTCAHNRDIDWLFFTDCDVPPDAPGNTVFRQTNFSSYCRDVSHKLGIRFAPTSPYKLCDLTALCATISLTNDWRASICYLRINAGYPAIFA